MYYTTGLAAEEITDLCEKISAADLEPGINHWPPVLGLFKSVAVTLTYLRRNHAQAELAEYDGVSQPTISRAITGLTPVIAKALAKYVPTAEDLKPGEPYIVDGTLAPCWSWRDHPELYSGKRKTTGYNLQVACDLDGDLSWVADPVNGNRHDIAALDISGVLDGLDPADWIGDKGYIGADMLTPIRKPAHRDLLDWEKEFNKSVGRIRYVIERAIANLKTWRILHTDYRRPLASFAQTISAVIALEFYRTTCE